jgi:hypothetical protein
MSAHMSVTRTIFLPAHTGGADYAGRYRWVPRASLHPHVIRQAPPPRLPGQRRSRPADWAYCLAPAHAYLTAAAATFSFLPLGFEDGVTEHLSFRVVLVLHAEPGAIDDLREANCAPRALCALARAMRTGVLLAHVLKLDIF